MKEMGQYDFYCIQFQCYYFLKNMNNPLLLSEIGLYLLMMIVSLVEEGQLILSSFFISFVALNVFYFKERQAPYFCLIFFKIN